MLTARTFILWIHLGAIVVWIGGMVTIPFVAAPVLRRSADHDAVVALVRRFQRLSRELILIVLLTGIFNVIFAGVYSGFHFSVEYLTLISAKFALFIALIANQMWYSYRLVPRALESSRNATLSAVVNVLLAAIVIFLGLSLRSV